MRTGKTIASFALLGILLVPGVGPVAAQNVVVEAGSVHEGDLRSRNDLITVGNGARIEGLIDSRNAPIQIGDEVVAGDVSTRNGPVTIGRNAELGSISSRNGAISIGAASQCADIESRNGRIDIGSDAVTGAVSNRNGAIAVGERVHVAGSIETRNGSINLSADSRIDGSVEARNGGIRLARASQVGGSVAARNGMIELDQAIVAGSITSRSGDVVLTNASEVKGDIRIELEDASSSRGWFNLGNDYPDAGNVSIFSGSHVTGDVIVTLPEDYDGEIPTVTIDADSSVQGTLKVDPRVTLNVEGEVSGGIAGESE